MTPQPANPQVTERGPRPNGSIPRNAQTWAIVAVAGLMLVVIWLGGGNPSQPSAAAAAKTAPHQPLPPTEERIKAYERNIAEQAARLEMEQRQAAQLARQLNQSMPPEALTGSGAGLQPAHTDRPREDRSLFATNIALSYRKSGAGQPSPQLQAPSKTAEAPEKESPDPEPQPAAGPRYRVLEGTVLEAVLTNRLSGEFTGPVNCMVTANVWSHSGRHLLIPQGSRGLGEARRVSELDQARLAIVFHRLIMPDGFSLDLDQFPGLGQTGDAGLKDKVNHHYVSTLGMSLALGAVSGLSLANTRYGFDYSGMDAYRQGMVSGLGNTMTRLLDRYLNRMPTVTIREGTRVKIVLSADLEAPAYDQHQLDPDL